MAKYFHAPSGVKGLTDDMIEVVYRYQNMQYRIQDVKNHIEDLEANGLIPIIEWNDKDIRFLASEFLDKYDCNIDENTQFETLITEFCKNLDIYQEHNSDYEPDLA